jgi:hypothetical protein
VKVLVSLIFIPFTFETGRENVTRRFGAVSKIVPSGKNQKSTPYKDVKP